VTKGHSGSAPGIGAMLKARFPAKHVDSALDHYGRMIGEFKKGAWEPSLVKAGKLVEAILKTLWVSCGNTLPRAKDFKVDHTIRELEKIPAATMDDALRVTIPRACRFIYEITSNRGARHDPDGIDPNVMDAMAVVSLCGWILAEMLRNAQKGLDPAGARNLVLRLTQKTLPNIEEVGDRIYFHVKGLNARTASLLLLWHAHPSWVSQKELIEHTQRHRFSEANARVGLARLRQGRVIDDDGHGNLRLLASGVAEAEGLLCADGRN
jgi:hypothetical protein